MPQHEQLKIVERIYETALDAAQWSDLLCLIADHCGAENASLVTADMRVPFGSVIAPRADPVLIEEYGRDWACRDPTISFVSNLPAGKFMMIRDMGRDRFVRSDYYNDYWRRLGYGVERLSVNLVNRDGALVNFGLQAFARRDEIDDEMHRRCAVLVPHLTRAVEIGRELTRLETARIATDNGSAASRCGVVAVDAKARVVFADEAAIALFEAEAGIRPIDGAVRLDDSDADKPLQAAIAACAGDALSSPIVRSIRCPRGEGTEPLSIDVMRYRAGLTAMLPTGPGLNPVAILLIRDPVIERQARADLLRSKFDLTQTEAIMAIEMLKGDGRSAAAKRCGISVNTARTHLSRIFDKVGVTRQAELVRTLMDAQDSAGN